jgi:ABC-type nickel/cobalt efflux system permease component RcnA
MNLADGIRKLGFRKWYQRELMRSHGHMLLLFLCAIGLLASFEAFDRSAPTSDRAKDVAAILLLASVGIWSLRRYLYLLMHAEEAARQAVCPQCETYGRLSLLAEQREHSPLRVQCKKCQHAWTIED